MQLDCSPSTRARKINSPANRKGYDKSETTVGKFSTRKIQIFRVYFCAIHFHLFQNNFPNNSRTKIYSVDLDSSRRIRQCRDLRSF